MVNIKRLRVEEGFFNTLDLNFSDGLNVLIGGRGVGKTSVIELLRFGLGAASVSDTVAQDSASHAMSILKSTGQVIIDLEYNGQIITVTRSAQESEPRYSYSYQTPIVFSQKEIETVGLNAAGKLSLIDSFLDNVGEHENQLRVLSGEVRSLSAAMLQTKLEYEESFSKTQNLTTLLAREKELIEKQHSYQTQNTSIKTIQDSLDNLQGNLSRLGVDEHNLGYLKGYFQNRKSQLDSLISTFENVDVSGGISSQLVTDAQVFIEGQNQTLTEMSRQHETMVDRISKNLSEIQSNRLQLDEISRGYRAEVEKYNHGAGAVLGELGRIREEIAQARNQVVLCEEKKAKWQQLYDDCQAKLALIANIRGLIYSSRKAVCENLNMSLSPSVNCDIEHLSRLDHYSDVMKSTMKGSGLKYNDVIEKVTSRISPQFMLFYVYSLNYQEFSNTTGLPLDRATRLLSYLSETDIGALLTADIQDNVSFRLLDGHSYKDIEELSIGQRCTVILSVILENTSRVLIIDQPEDHLDNEFIATILIKALSERAQKVQTIVSSHNANIPVLGNASTVVSLESNGRNGYIKNIGPIYDPSIKLVIESIMEGGKEAFSRRASFYSQ